MKQNSGKCLTKVIALALTLILGLGSLIMPTYAEESDLSISLNFVTDESENTALSINFYSERNTISIEYVNDAENNKTKVSEVTLSEEEKNSLRKSYMELDSGFDNDSNNARDKSLGLLDNALEFFPEIINVFQKPLDKYSKELGYKNFDDRLRFFRERENNQDRIIIRPKKVEVILDYDNNEVIKPVYYEFRSKIGEIKRPEKKDHEFLGWFTPDKDGNELSPVGNDARVGHNMILIAKWKEVETPTPAPAPAPGPAPGPTPAPAPGPAPGPTPAPAPADETIVEIDEDVTPLGSLNTVANNANTNNAVTTIEEDKTPLGEAVQENKAYIKGYEDKTVQPEGKVTREAAAAVLFRLMDEKMLAEVKSEEFTFSDLKDTDWSYEAVMTLVKAGVFKGYTDGSFQPKKAITRAELSFILARFFKVEAAKEHRFSDIKGHWAEDFIAGLAAKSYVGGYPDGSFQANKDITRAEFAAIINKILGRKVRIEEIKAEHNQFSDLSPDKWYYVDMILASMDYKATVGEDGIQKLVVEPKEEAK